MTTASKITTATAKPIPNPTTSTFTAVAVMVVVVCVVIVGVVGGDGDGDGDGDACVVDVVVFGTTVKLSWVDNNGIDTDVAKVARKAVSCAGNIGTDTEIDPHAVLVSTDGSNSSAAVRVWPVRKLNCLRNAVF